MKKKQDNKFIILGLIIVVLLGLYAISTIPEKKVIDYDSISQEELGAVINLET